MNGASGKMCCLWCLHHRMQGRIPTLLFRDVPGLIYTSFIQLSWTRNTCFTPCFLLLVTLATIFFFCIFCKLLQNKTCSFIFFSGLLLVKSKPSDLNSPLTTKISGHRKERRKKSTDEHIIKISYIDLLSGYSYGKKEISMFPKSEISLKFPNLQEFQAKACSYYQGFSQKSVL